MLFAIMVWALAAWLAGRFGVSYLVYTALALVELAGAATETGYSRWTDAAIAALAFYWAWKDWRGRGGGGRLQRLLDGLGYKAQAARRKLLAALLAGGDGARGEAPNTGPGLPAHLGGGMHAVRSGRGGAAS